MKKLLSCKWLKKTNTMQSDTKVWNESMSPSNLKKESYWKALEQFRHRRQSSTELVTNTEFYPYQSMKQNGERLSKKNKYQNVMEAKKCEKVLHLPGVPYVQASEIFEIGCVAGTEDRYLELICAEWHNTRVSLKRYTNPSCQDAIRADIEVLTTIRHPNVLLLMAATHTDDYGLVSIFESVNCTLYNFIHEQGERISIQNIAQISMKLADALKYCHMRGYIHGAISSHCVYFASNGGVKLGGWELAISKNDNTIRNYENILRTEIFKWQAPEFFYGLSLSTQSDIYGLSLLIWEMGTARIPWVGCNRPHVEMQYISRKSGVIMDLSCFPLSLKKILENGLQLDIIQRTLNMDKIRKTLRRLLMSEEEEAYINGPGILESRYSISDDNNNHKIKNVYMTVSKTTPPYENMMLIRKPSVDQLSYTIENINTKPLVKSIMIQCNRDLDENGIQQKNASLTENDTTELTSEANTTYDAFTKNLNLTKKYKTDEELRNNTRSDIKRLKEINASRREHFFHEINSSNSSHQTASSRHTTVSPRANNNNTDYILYKPASHTTNMELKCKKSPGEYEGTFPKPSRVVPRKTNSYVHMPASIKDAIIQRQVLHPDINSFYESTLWRKERQICLSRMAHENKKEVEHMEPTSQQLDININFDTDNKKTPHIELDASELNDTFNLENASEKKGQCTEKVSLECERRNSSTSSSTLTPDNPLQDLKDALDRAAEIVRSTTPYKESLSSQNDYTSNINLDNSQQFDSSLHEDVFKIKSDDSDQDIIDIDKPFANSSPKMDKSKIAENKIQIEHGKKCDKISVNYDTYNSTHTDKHACESVKIKTTFEKSKILTQKLSENLQKPSEKRKIYNSNMLTSLENKTAGLKQSAKEFIEKNTVSLLSKNTTKCENCNLYNTSELRRRSLPARLNQLKITQNPTLKNMHTCRKRLLDSYGTIEDLYIDDEFGSRLNDNLVLINDGFQSYTIDNYSYDGQLPQTTEL